MIIAFLKNCFLESCAIGAILISDWLVESILDRGAISLGKACHSEFEAKAFGTVAIVRQVRRVTDIDRTISPDCTGRNLEIVLGLVIDRLRYLAPPGRQLPVNCNPIVVRPLRADNETEWRNYFLLRHRVYTIMGYLTQEVECSPSRLEVNEADVHAIHIGAFHRDGVQERLVGTARVVTNSEADRALQETFEAITGQDQIARQSLDTPYFLGLPIFHTHEAMNPIMQEVFTTNQSCGELSRVIVSPEYRGSGISQKLIREALRRSVAKGAQRVFLECLPVHERVYEKHGFRRIEGVAGPVVDVGRTMIAMEICPAKINDVRADLYRVA
jgi:predicted GNAT family N-acyltransferase